jgi:hypothetical protein
MTFTAKVLTKPCGLRADVSRSALFHIFRDFNFVTFVVCVCHIVTCDCVMGDKIRSMN